MRKKAISSDGKRYLICSCEYSIPEKLFSHCIQHKEDELDIHKKLEYKLLQDTEFYERYVNHIQIELNKMYNEIEKIRIKGTLNHEALRKIIEEYIKEKKTRKIFLKD
ncbi:MAG: hypothetical protein K6F69_10625 [Treponema sp.]|nr:hypothetical protein [Treponema sp.]